MSTKSLLAALNKSLKAAKISTEVTTLCQEPKPVDVIPTGSIGLNEALGVGGYPLGRIVEVYGKESSGKTTLCLHAVAEAQKCGYAAAFVDMEHAFDPAYAKAIGVDLEQLLFTQPECGEDALNVVETMVSTDEPMLVIVDSVAALTPRAEIEGEMGDSYVALQARLMSQAMRKLVGVIYRRASIVIFTNQTRDKIGVLFGAKTTTPGGNALKFYASVRIDIRRVSQVKEAVNVNEQIVAVGNQTIAKVVKNKVAPPFKEATFTIRWGQGIDHIDEVLETALASGAIVRAGSSYKFGGDTFRGRAALRRAMIENAELLKAVLSA